MIETPETAYIKEEYGSCNLGAKCSCLKTGWRGRACSEWVPVREFSIAGMIEAKRKSREDASRSFDYSADSNCSDSDSRSSQ